MSEAPPITPTRSIGHIEEHGHFEGSGFVEATGVSVCYRKREFVLSTLTKSPSALYEKRAVPSLICLQYTAVRENLFLQRYRYTRVMAGGLPHQDTVTYSEQFERALIERGT